jgi:hypothetical protein
MTTCANASPNVGTFYGLKNSGLGTPVGIIITPENYSMAAADFLLLAQHVIGAKARMSFLLRQRNLSITVQILLTMISLMKREKLQDRANTGLQYLHW